jgi:UDP-N-acetylmuramate--alanine ligase
VINLNEIQNVYFLGIGGIGMSALARYFHANGMVVAGYDRTSTHLTEQLIAEGIDIHFDDLPGLIPKPFRSPENTLVILTPAIPGDHTELEYFRKNNFVIYKRSQILGLITKDKKAIAVAGTHGKTTVSTMIAHILSASDMGCSAFLGGISRNYKSNLLLNPQSEWVVVEADEFDRSFLQLHPQIAVVTAIDPDHLDIYGNPIALNDAFDQFIGQINSLGLLLMKNALRLDPANMPSRVFTYSLQENTDFYADNIRLINKKYHFDLVGPDITVRDISLIHPGLVNVENAVAATAVAKILNIDPDIIRSAMENFLGIQRRFDIHIATEKTIYIDDYAHHPKELEATINSVRELYPDKKITGIFQPHLYSRTRDLADGFAQSLSLLDELILLDIYAAREEPIEGISAETIFAKVTLKNKIRCAKQELLHILQKRKIEVLLTLGAGDIDTFVEPIKELFSW